MYTFIILQGYNPITMREELYHQRVIAHVLFCLHVFALLGRARCLRPLLLGRAHLKIYIYMLLLL